MSRILNLAVLIILNNIIIVLIGLLIHNQMVELKPLQVFLRNYDEN